MPRCAADVAPSRIVSQPKTALLIGTPHFPLGSIIGSGKAARIVDYPILAQRLL
jgi:hypothetical protein